MLRPAVLAACAAAAAGHGSINRPPPRNNAGNASFGHNPGCAGGACYWYQVGCMSGCKCSGYEKDIVNGGYYAQPKDFGCANPTEPTLNDKNLRTWNVDNKSPKGDWTKYFPWRAPGTAIPIDPCGIESGFTHQVPDSPPTHPVAGLRADAGAAYPSGTKGTTLPPLKGAPTVWRAGATTEVSFGQFVNHGGGYQYRLCPKSKKPTEECFQATPLAFATSTHRVHFEDGSRPDETFAAVDVSKGVVPVGAAWRRNPIPACNCDMGFVCGTYSSQPNAQPYSGTKFATGDQCDQGVQFEPPAQGLFGYWVPNNGNPMLNRFSIVDTLKVPEEEGEYLLSWRWDCEQTPQVWNACADITISKTGPLPPPPAPPAPAARYHCDKATSTCAKASSGHSSLATCQAACGPAPSPPAPVPPTPPTPPSPSKWCVGGKVDSFDNCLCAAGKSCAGAGCQRCCGDSSWYDQTCADCRCN